MDESSKLRECEENFRQLKHLLTKSMILKIVDPNKDLLVCTNAYKEGLGVLMQDRYAINYESRKLSEHKKHYVMHNLEFILSTPLRCGDITCSVTGLC